MHRSQKGRAVAALPFGVQPGATALLAIVDVSDVAVICLLFACFLFCVRLHLFCFVFVHLRSGLSLALLILDFRWLFGDKSEHTPTCIVGVCSPH